jgi:hypothetical protein
MGNAGSTGTQGSAGRADPAIIDMILQQLNSLQATVDVCCAPTPAPF